METEPSTKDENKRGESSQNDQQKLETGKILEKTSPNFEESHDAVSVRESLRKIALQGEDDTGKAVKISENIDERESVALSQCEYENKVLVDVVRLLGTPTLPKEEQEEEKENDMSRLAPKTKVPNKSISRPSLSQVNSKIPGELSGQPSIKNTREDTKYWKSREQELLDRIAALESKAANAEAAKERHHGSVDQAPQPQHHTDTQASVKDKENYKTRLHQIEKELFAKQKEQANESSQKSGKSPDEIITHLKAQNEDLRGALAKMTAILRDKTALCVSQEKKVAALTNQVESLKEVVAITKDLLNIRNMEVQHISNDIQAMESKIDCERQRHNQMLIKMDEAVKLNTELKKEYENQMRLFQQLRDSYEEKIRLLSQNGPSEEIKDQGNEHQKNSIAGPKPIQAASGKASRSSNFKVNFQDT